MRRGETVLKEERLKHLNEVLGALAWAHYGGYKISWSEEEFKAFEWAVKKLEHIKEVYPELFLD